MFPRHIQGRGVLIRYSDIRILGTSAEQIFAKIRGTSDYETKLTLRPDGVALACTCPYFETAGACKHLWALLLYVDSKRLLDPELEKAILEQRIYEERTGSKLFQDSDEDLLPPLRPVPPPSQQLPPPPEWRAKLSKLPQGTNPLPEPEVWPDTREILYSVNESSGTGWGSVTLRVWTRDCSKTGKRLRAKPIHCDRKDLLAIPNKEDQEILVSLCGAGRGTFIYSMSEGPVSGEYLLTRDLALRLLPRMCALERCFFTLDVERGDFQPLEWNPDEWRLIIEIRKEGEGWVAEPLLEREGERRGLASVSFLEAGLVVAGQSISPIAKNQQSMWLQPLRQMGKIQFPESARDDVVIEFLNKSAPPPLDLPAEARFREEKGTPVKVIRFDPAGPDSMSGPPMLRGEARFKYGDASVNPGALGHALFRKDQRLILHRDVNAENLAVQELVRLGMTRTGKLDDWFWLLEQSRLGAVAPELLRSGWHVEVEGHAFIRPDRSRTGISSGIDWFDVNAEVDFGNMTVGLPQLLEALQNGSDLVALPDGSLGLIPAELRDQMMTMMRLGRVEEGSIRFHRAHTGLLDALLATAPEVQVDETFLRMREELRRFTGIEPAEQPPGFRGQLRDYQKAGLAWMHFLRRFGFGGCLADDMGVGKTAQVLALLETRRQQGDGPSLVVVPKSLVFNWQEEAAQFTPDMRVLAHVGVERSVESIRDYDLILTTYGTLRRDVPVLREIEFDYVILDEAQAVKNPASESAKAVRLLRGKHRLAMSGTPIENHLGELWSIFEFLNPGMLEAANIFRGAKKNARSVSEEIRPWLAHALRPFLLRRTKQQVAKELPPKMEQTLVCEMETKQRELYDELRVHYRQSLLGRIDRQGLAKSRMHVLEALLRLRQAACHPGLIDKNLESGESAKLDLLIDQLEEVTEEGHKALVFSQFTSLLAILETRMKKAGITYVYLDGSTTAAERKRRVNKFQTDEATRAFLISLKAGGLGLNLTAADYVFLLDPWWNPAVEAQAIDRAHRIGQTQHVFAYRLIVKDTVEEKILELQKTKRDLATAIVSEDSSVFQSLKREDLEMLLS